MQLSGRLRLIGLFCFLLTTTVLGQSQIPSPRQVIGFTPGEDRKLANWQQITSYFTRLSQVSPRLTLRELGRTTNGKPFLLATITAPENQQRLDFYRALQRKLADPRIIEREVQQRLASAPAGSTKPLDQLRQEAIAAEVAKLVDAGKAVVVISCSIHATEVVGSQMALELAYRLVADDSAETREILQNTIILLFPSMNPDGVDIVANWYQKTLGTPAEGSSPPELYHHYAGHDNNRDWFMLNLAETRLATQVFYHEWFPHVFYDVHQQGATGSRMFVPPFFDPPNPNIDPLLLRQVAMVGEHMAADLTAAGFKGISTYSTYDTWWHGGFRTAPYYHNAVGILTEAASTRLATPIEVTQEDLAKTSTRGLPSALERSTNFPEPWLGGTWRMADIRDMELTTARSLLKLAARYRREWLHNFYELGRKQIALGRTQAPYAYVVPPNQTNPATAERLIQILTAQGVEVQKTTKELALNKQTYPAGTYIIPLAQPYRANVKALFETQEYPKRLNAKGEAERPYDVAGWTLPMMMGVHYTVVEAPGLVAETAAANSGTLVKPTLLSPRTAAPTAGNAARSATPAEAAPHVRLALYQSYTASMDEGWTRYVLEHPGHVLQGKAPQQASSQEVAFRYTSLRDAEVRAGRLRDKYDVIILPSSSTRDLLEGLSRERYPAQFAGGLGREGVAALRAFVTAGGVLICLDQATDFAIKQFNLPVRNVLQGLKSNQFFCPGSLLRVTLDQTHPVAQHLPQEVDAYFVNSQAFEIFDERGARTVARYGTGNPLRSGWLLGEEHIAGKTAIADVQLGQGRVLLFGFRPQFRAQTHGTYQLLFNAILHAGR